MTENELMLTSIFDCRRVDLVVHSRKLTPAQESRYNEMRVRRAEGEPLQYITGQCEFMGIPLAVDARALIPRPETEILVELAIEKAKSISTKAALNALDLGAGSGNISIALAKNIENITITALDISDSALTLAEKNAKANGVEQKIKFRSNDMIAYLRDTMSGDEKFDMIISNPPYIPTSQLAQLPVDVQREPAMALDGGKDGLHFYKAIIQHAHRTLKSGGFLLMEIGDGQRGDIEVIFGRDSQYSQISFYKDYVGTDRIVIAWKN